MFGMLILFCIIVSRDSTGQKDGTKAVDSWNFKEIQTIHRLQHGACIKGKLEAFTKQHARKLVTGNHFYFLLHVTFSLWTVYRWICLFLKYVKHQKSLFVRNKKY